MTRYCGGKQKIAKKIHEYILDIEDKIRGNHSDPYFEPFCGMMSVGLEFAEDEEEKDESEDENESEDQEDDISNEDFRKIIVCDANPDIVAFWKEIKEGWLPPESLRNITEENYNKYKISNKASAKKAFVGSVFSFGGTYYGSFRGLYQSRNQTIRDYENGYNRIEDIQPLLDYITILKAQPYNSTSITSMVSKGGYTIYCDPPYERSLGRGANPYISTFNSLEFWEVMRKWSENNLVFISEDQSSPPVDFICVWNTKVNRQFFKGSSNKTLDCIFVHKSICKKYPRVFKVIKRIKSRQRKK